MTQPEIHPAHYAVQKVWRQVYDDIAETEHDIDRASDVLATHIAKLNDLRANRIGLEAHAAQQGWVLKPWTRTEL